MPQFTEELWLQGALALDGWGNDLNNNIQGNNAVNRLYGAGGNDQLFGFAGNDTLDGGAGNDTATYSGSFGSFTVNRSGANAYTVSLGAETDTLLNIESLRFVNAGLSTFVALTTGGLTLSDTTPRLGQTITLANTLANTQSLSITGTQWQFFDGAAWQPIDGATGASFTPGASQLGQSIRAQLTYTDTLGSGRIASSEPTAAVWITAATQTNGSDDADALNGGAGFDALFGLGGNDTLAGGAGSDLLHGGLGADHFRYAAGSDSPVGIAARDVIADFLAGSDQIDLSAIDADLTTPGDQAFSSIAANATITGPGQLSYRSETIAGTLYTIIEGNVDADLAFDFQIAVLGSHSFTLGPDLAP
jgi:Ca2+-binding RTX toxin-like protein